MNVLVVLALLAAGTSAQLSDPIAHDGNMRNTASNKYLARSAVDDTEDDGAMCVTHPASPASVHHRRATTSRTMHTRRALSGSTASPERSWWTADSPGGTNETSVPHCF